ncbi:hypothetical protein [Umezakia ovalisporum]|jgi:hypothetical protein|uniref:hypothetical protein n=1 Tax=Umezakia ovalisporum TaxID=75695 RepID=UPI0026CAD364
MLKDKLLLPLTAIIAFSLMSCASLSSSNTSTSVPKQDNSNSVGFPESSVADQNQPSSEFILNEVISRQKNLQVCNFEFNPEAAKKLSQVYPGGINKYLVQLLCFMAAYQGAFTFLEVDTSEQELKIKSLKLEMAGLPAYEPKTKILSNTYKLVGAGTCIQETQHYWSGDQLRLVSSQLISQVPNACQELGALTPSPNQVITNKNVGVAKLGMTLGELKQVLGEDTKFEPISLGVDVGEGIQVSQDGNVQYFLGFADQNNLETGNKQPITNNSQITMITVENADYRTKDGVGPGTPLKAAVAAYGEAKLFYNLNNEAREYIKFERGLGADPQVLIRSNQWTITQYAGVYLDTKAEFNQTQKYHEHAGIGSITIKQ